MNAAIIDDIPVDIQADHLYQLLRIKPESAVAARLDRLLNEALAIARPTAACTLSAVEREGEDRMRLDGIPFRSRVLSVNLQNCRRAFPFLATCGRELDSWSRNITGTLEAYWADTIAMLALGAAISAVEKHVKNAYQAGETSTMNPGSLKDWPLEEQKSLFALLGDAGAAMGIALTENNLMVPLKSVSGIAFESGEKFYNCQLCPRPNCPGRRAPYDGRLYADKYAG